jgi:GT2 family glycosyltransferase
MQGTPSISVVLPVYIKTQKNISDTLKCITLLRSKTRVPFELVIVETSSKHFIGLADVYVYEKERTTPNRSVQRGFDCCKSDFVVFIGNDVFVDDNWLECLLDCFSKQDCGIATLGNSEHDNEKKDLITEGIYFSVCMVRKKDAWFDNNYTFVFDDTDMIFRIYESGRKSYKNLNCIVQHNPHTTLGEWGGEKEEYERCRAYFVKKWANCSTNPLYRRFSGCGQ